jgi:hypothetical protein
MRKTLIGVLVTALLGVATPAAAETITMICKYKDYTRIFKYVDPLIGKKKVFGRVEGAWVEWGDEWKEPELGVTRYRPFLSTIKERGAVMRTTYKITADKDYPAMNLKKGDIYLQHDRFVFDFEFLTKTTSTWLTKMDGSPQIKGKLMHDPDKPHKEKWNCKKYEPNKTKN